MYAVVKTGGKQYKVAPGARIRVERIDQPRGEMVELAPVHLLVRDDGTVVSSPAELASARVVAQVRDHDRNKKIRVYTYRRRKDSERTLGHRQWYTELEIKEIRG
ncbi:MAG TPA: 50S ribosomal protein L21 [Candidatus Hydrogenedentes bacterium]|nr:50S ribosomal protein L21 [Candidatus Hydrogenedentota bacterium]HOV60202.1 50S ribosomal protein L21 [Candidatus Hydrogenedentota bacterium]